MNLEYFRMKPLFYFTKQDFVYSNQSNLFKRKKHGKNKVSIFFESTKT